VRPFLALFIYIAVVFPGGALLAPGLWHLGQFAAQHFPGPFWQHLAHCPFHRFMDRAFLVLALAGLWPLLRTLGVRSRADLGLISPAGQGGLFLAGLAAGFLTLGAVAALAVYFGGRPLVYHLPAARVAAILAGGLGTAAVVAVLEEILFRGGIFNGLRRVFWWPAALVASSLIYALVHFLQHGEVTGPVTWTSGLTLLPGLLGGFADLGTLIPGFFTLTLAGLLLGLAYQRTENLYFSIGMHGGWIFWLKIYRSVTVDAPDVSVWLWGTGKLIDGWAAFLLLFLVLLVGLRLPGKQPKLTIPP